MILVTNREDTERVEMVRQMARQCLRSRDIQDEKSVECLAEFMWSGFELIVTLGPDVAELAGRAHIDGCKNVRQGDCSHHEHSGN